MYVYSARGAMNNRAGERIHAEVLRRRIITPCGILNSVTSLQWSCHDSIYIRMMMLAPKLVISAGYTKCAYAIKCRTSAASVALRHHYHAVSSLSEAHCLPPSGEISEDEDPSSTRALFDAMDSASVFESRNDGGKTTTVLGAGTTNVPWKELDQKVNTYPSDRRFQAIGEGGDAFVAEIVNLVESAFGREVSPADVQSRPSSKGKYVSASVTTRLNNGQEVEAVYSALKGCDKVKWYL